MSESSTPGKLIRRNIHTYPFKYTYTAAKEYFAPEKGSIYVHVPFCSTKCHFCDYVVTVNKSLDLRESYVKAVCREIEQFPLNPAFPAFTIDAVYIGGGTPGLLSGEQLIRILDACRRTYSMVEEPEACVEFDPASVEAEKLEMLWDAGFTRVSVGVQSFNDDILVHTNRPHRLADVYRALEILNASRFTHTNLDLIYPLGGLTLDIWEDSLRQAIDFGPACITAYPIEIWPNTVYHRRLKEKKLSLPTAAEETAMARMAFDRLEAAGYTTGSSSGYYHPQRTREYCRFLTYYWRTLPMIGFGVGSKTVIHDRLYTNIKRIKDYITRVEAGEPILDFSTRMTKRQEMNRVVVRGLKVGDVDKAGFNSRFGVALRTVFGKEIDDLVEKGLLFEDESEIRITRAGQVLANNVYEAFYTEDDLRPARENEVQFGISDLVVLD